ncbi:MAG TPA: hypothetical protein ENH15_05185, partial [Actinobacteria bacterium]|nr:hypothetical protein [Actinomycetota bacterium]
MTAVHLVSMPWPPPYTPSLPLAQLAAVVRRADRKRTVAEHHLYLEWYEVLFTQYGDDGARSVYSNVADRGAYLGIGDYIFSSKFSAITDSITDVYAQLLHAASIDLPALGELCRLADQFVASTADRLAEDIPQGAVVGFSSTYTQTVASLSLIEPLKELRPDLHVVLGGYNMNEERASILVREHPIDRIVVGDGEDAIVTILHEFDKATSITRRDQGIVQTPPIDMRKLPSPDFRGYFEVLERSAVNHLIEPKLGYEIGRGCWWGERRHCTFCGLNGESMAYRKRDAHQVVTDLTQAIAEYRSLDVFFADNILDPD